MVGLAGEGGNYRRVVIGAAVAGTVGLALYIGVKQYNQWRSQQTSGDQEADKSSSGEGKPGEETSKSGESSPEKPKEPPKTPEPPKPSPDPKPSKPPTVVQGRTQSSKEKDETPKTSQTDKEASIEKPGPSKDQVPSTIPKDQSKDKGGTKKSEEKVPPKKVEDVPKPQPPKPVVPSSVPKDQSKDKDSDKKPEEKVPPKKVEDVPKPQPPKPVEEKKPIATRAGEAVKTDTDIVVIEEPWHWSQPPEKPPKAEDAHKDIEKPAEAVAHPKASPTAPPPTPYVAAATAAAAEKIEAFVKEAVASTEPASLGDDIEIIPDSLSLGDSGDFVKLSPEVSLSAQPPILKVEEKETTKEKVLHEKEIVKPKEESKIPLPVKEGRRSPVVVQVPKSEPVKESHAVGHVVSSVEEKMPKEKDSHELSKEYK